MGVILTYPNEKMESKWMDRECISLQESWGHPVRQKETLGSVRGTVNE
jgi:hypothetical protein